MPSMHRRVHCTSLKLSPLDYQNASAAGDGLILLVVVVVVESPSPAVGGGPSMQSRPVLIG